MLRHFSIDVPLTVGSNNCTEFYEIRGKIIKFFVNLIFVVVYSIIALLQRNWDLVARVAGVPSIAETMQEETHGIDVALVSESSAKAKE